MQKYFDLAVQWRQHLHQYPELSFQEYETSRFILETLQKQLKNAQFQQLTPTSVLVSFKTGRDGAKIGLRADIDALPIQEERTELAFCSKRDGVMHACGHDGHTAILMAVCVWIDEHFSDLTGEIHAIFQHAEEKLPGGAQELVKTGFFNDFDFIYGQHLMSMAKTGILDIKDGACSANTDAYNITIFGKGGHAAMPEKSIDPIVIGAQFVTLLQTIVARRVNPHDSMVISNTVFQAGSAQNIIPDTAKLTGSVRTTSEAYRQFARKAIEDLIKNLCETYGARYELHYEIGYSVTWNHPEKTAIVRELAQKRYGETQVVAYPAMMGGEDFSAFAQASPATFAIIGSANAGNDYPHHHPKFGLDEESFHIGIQMMVDVVLNGKRFRNA